MSRLVIDSDKLVYDVCFTTQKSTHFLINDDGTLLIPRKTRSAAMAWCKKNLMNGEFHTKIEVEPLSHALYLIKRRINSIINKYPHHTPELHLTHPDLDQNFRYHVAKTWPYKGNRVDNDRPIHYKDVREYLVNQWNAIVSVGWEADDTVLFNYKEGDIIAGVDKDLFQFPATFYNFDKDEEFTVTPKEGMYNLYVQVIMGDAVDNIPGMRIYCKPRTMGKKTAEKTISPCDTPKECYEAIKALYIKNLEEEFDEELFRERFKEQCQLLYLMRHKDDTWEWDKIDDNNE